MEGRDTRQSADAVVGGLILIYSRHGQDNAMLMNIHAVFLARVFSNLLLTRSRSFLRGRFSGFGVKRVDGGAF